MTPRWSQKDGVFSLSLDYGCFGHDLTHFGGQKWTKFKKNQNLVHYISELVRSFIFLTLKKPVLTGLGNFRNCLKLFIFWRF